MDITLNINTDGTFAPLPIGKVTITTHREEGGSLILGSNYCWHRSAGVKERRWNYIIDEEDYPILIKLLQEIGGEMKVQVSTRLPAPTVPHLPPPLDLDEL